MELSTKPETSTKIVNTPLRYDTGGKHINAHGGGILFQGGTYYWYGEYRNPKIEGQPGTAGVGCYTSKDLCNWKNEGVVLATIKNDPNHDSTAGCTIERPKVIYNARTGKFGKLWLPEPKTLDAGHRHRRDCHPAMMPLLRAVVLCDDQRPFPPQP